MAFSFFTLYLVSAKCSFPIFIFLVIVSTEVSIALSNTFYEILRRNPSDVGVISGQKPCTKIIYIVLQSSVGLF